MIWSHVAAHRGRRPGRFLVMALALAMVVALVVGLTSSGTAHADRVQGEGPLDEILEAAERHAGACPDRPSRSLSATLLAAVAIAPTYPETGAPASQAPSPMTLSRYDTNSRLFSFGDPDSYREAFWHPGVGAWQWDEASLRGWTAAERIRSEVVVPRTMAVIAEGLCNSSTTWPEERAEARAEVWGRWYGCRNNTCEQIFQEIVQRGELVDIVPDASVSRRGGLLGRTCRDGEEETFRCWYVVPSRAQGYRGFLASGFGPAPVTAPFYSWSDGVRQHRVWFAEDTGYRFDIHASLVEGANSRTSLQWERGTQLCDVARGVGVCDTAPPDGFEQVALTIDGSYRPFTGDFDGDGYDDLFLYGRGSRGDRLWMGGASRFRSTTLTVSGTYLPLPGDFNGDGRDDILWYGPGSSPDSLWFGASDGFSYASVRVRGTYSPLVGDFDGDGRSDIFWYGKGGGSDSSWYGRRDGGFDSVRLEVSGPYTPVAGDFDGNGTDDVLWYTPGTDRDPYWRGTGRRGAFRYGSLTVDGTYRPSSGDLDGDGHDDVIWYGPGSDRDSLWYGSGSDFLSRRNRMGGDRRVAVGDFDGSGGADVLMHDPGTPIDLIWWRD